MGKAYNASLTLSLTFSMFGGGRLMCVFKCRVFDVTARVQIVLCLQTEKKRGAGRLNTPSRPDVSSHPPLPHLSNGARSQAPVTTCDARKLGSVALYLAIPASHPSIYDRLACAPR